jgi:hypothetical protein
VCGVLNMLCALQCTSLRPNSKLLHPILLRLTLYNTALLLLLVLAPCTLQLATGGIAEATAALQQPYVSSGAPTIDPEWKANSATEPVTVSDSVMQQVYSIFSMSVHV